jgi:hypothetical protein
MKKIIFFTAAVTFALTFGVALAQDGNARDMSGTTSNNDAGMSSPGAGDSLGTGGTSTGLGTGGTSTGGAGGLGTGGTTTGMGTGGTGTSLGTGGTGTSGTGGPGM